VYIVASDDVVSMRDTFKRLQVKGVYFSGKLTEKFVGGGKLIRVRAHIGRYHREYFLESITNGISD